MTRQKVKKMELTSMTRNAIIACAKTYARWSPIDGDIGLKRAIASLDYLTVKGTYSLGKLGLADVVAWLAEDGLAMAGYNSVKPVRTATQSRLDAAVKILRNNGYQVIEPS